MTFRLNLRHAAPRDAALLLEWRNDPKTRSASRVTRGVQPAEHRRWLARTIADPRRDLLVAELSGVPVGQIRFDRLGDDTYEISVALAPSSRGKGLGSKLILAAVTWLGRHRPAARVIAEVRSSNATSLRAFHRAGFSRAPGPVSMGFARLERNVS